MQVSEVPGDGGVCGDWCRAGGAAGAARGGERSGAERGSGRCRVLIAPSSIHHRAGLGSTAVLGPPLADVWRWAVSC